jgi:conjugative transfer region protein TrbK
MTDRPQRLPAVVAALIALLVVAACEIRLRDDQGDARSAAPLAKRPDSTAAKLEQCRTVTYQRADALLQCRKIWVEQRRQFLGQNSAAPTRSDGDRRNVRSSPSPAKDEARLPSGDSAIPAQRQ